jgi:hypothetical protein
MKDGFSGSGSQMAREDTVKWTRGADSLALKSLRGCILWLTNSQRGGFSGSKTGSQIAKGGGFFGSQIPQQSGFSSFQMANQGGFSGSGFRWTRGGGFKMGRKDSLMAREDGFWLWLTNGEEERIRWLSNF